MIRIFKDKSKHCLVTITSSGFIPGTLVMLHTFHKYNSWFEGDILIYSRQLSPSEKEMLSGFPKVHFLQPDPALIKRIDVLIKLRPDITHKSMVFYSLNIFNLPGYDKYIYVDSDAFFQDTIVELVSKPHRLMCAPDRATYLNKAKDSLTYQIAQNPDSSPRYWFNTFNAGIMVIDKALVDRSVFDAILRLVDPENYRTLTRPTTDQYLLNQYFRESYHRLSSSYNYRLGIADTVKKQEGVNLENAKIIHFTGQKKPWIGTQAIRATQNFELYLKAFGKWNEEYLDYLKAIHKRTFAP